MVLDTHKKISISILLFSLFFLLNHTIFAASWTSRGPYGGNINCMAISKINPDTIYAGTNSGVFKSLDGGNSWIKTGFPDVKVVLTIQVAPEGQPDVVYAGTYRKGVYKTIDGGDTWALKGLAGQQVNTIAIDPNNPYTIYAGTGNWSIDWTDEVTGIFKSWDGGDTWSTILSYSDHDGLSQVNSILVDPDDSSYIYLGGQKSGSLSSSTFQVSTDGGVTWENKSFYGAWSKVIALKITPAGHNPKVLYALWEKDYSLPVGYDLYASIDMGENWTRQWSYDPDPGFSGAIDIDPSFPDNVYLGTHIAGYPFISYNFVENQWSPLSWGLPPHPPSSIVISPKGDGYICTGFHDGGVYKIESHETSWHITPMINTGIRDLSVDPTSSDTVFATVTSGVGDIARTTDGGRSWNYLQGGGSGPIAIDPQNSSNIYAADSHIYSRPFLIYKSVDGGESWTDMVFRQLCPGFSDCDTRVSDILISENNPGFMMVATTYLWGPAGLFGWGGLYRSTNGGQSWQNIGGANTTLAVDPNNDNVVYGGKSLAGQIYRYSNIWGDSIFTEEITPSGEFDYIRDIEVDLSSNVYVATDNGLLKWDHDWTKLTGIPTKDITALAVDKSKSPGIIYVGTGEYGVFLSENGGTTWRAFNKNLGSLSITKLAISTSLPKMLYAGTAYGGVWSLALDKSPNEIPPPSTGTPCLSWLMLLLGD